MNILINATNQKGYGGGQVTDSLCRNLADYPQHYFIVVLNPKLESIHRALSAFENVTVVMYGIHNDLCTLLFGRDKFLDGLVREYNIDGVLSVFGPTRWNPRCPHLAGFALSQIIMPESPFYRIMSRKEYIIQKVRNGIWKYYFRKGTKYLYTENPFITGRVAKQWKDCEVITVTNYYNQVFDDETRWVEHKLPKFDGCTILTLSRNDKHKHITITFDICRVLKNKYPSFRFRFVLPESEMTFDVPDDLKCYYVLTDLLPVEQLPSIYSQCDIAFQPTLLECFTATYPEAMRMRLPLIVCDLEFAHGLCGDAALYFPWNDAEKAAEQIYKAYNNRDMRKELIANGIKQLEVFDNYKERTNKLLYAIEKLITNGTIF